jgi:hypothetical protein
LCHYLTVVQNSRAPIAARRCPVAAALAKFRQPFRIALTEYVCWPVYRLKLGGIPGAPESNPFAAAATATATAAK